VATFRGRTSLEGAVRKRPLGGRQDSPSQDENPLAVAAEKAHLLTHALRSKGWEAFEFHDRTESIVTVGSLERVARQTLAGRDVPTGEVQTIVRTFGAAFEPVLTSAEARENHRLREQAKQKFQVALASMPGQTAPGLNPKFLVGIPFDIHPTVMEVPRRSISRAYAR
jgi:hypothetical protein